MRTLLMIALVLALPTAAEAGKKDTVRITIDGEEVTFFEDGKLNVGEIGRFFGGNQWGSDSLRIGVWLDTPGPALSAQLGIEPEDGILVSQIVDGGPAESGGMRQYDIIVEVAGKPVHAVDDVQDALADLEDGDSLALTILRAGKRHKLDLTPERGVAFSGPFGHDNPWIEFYDGDEGNFAVIARSKAAEAEAHALEAEVHAREAAAEAAESIAERLRETEERLKELEKRLDEAAKRGD